MICYVRGCRRTMYHLYLALLQTSCSPFDGLSSEVTCDAPASDHTGSRPFLPLVTWLRQTHCTSVRIKCHTVTLCAFEPQQGNVVLPALIVILSVDNDAFRGQGAFKIILLLGVVVPQAQHIAGWVSAKSERVIVMMVLMAYYARFVSYCVQTHI